MAKEIDVFVTGGTGYMGSRLISSRAKKERKRETNLSRSCLGYDTVPAYLQYRWGDSRKRRGRILEAYHCTGSGRFSGGG